MEEIIRIKANWDVDNATYLTHELYKYVAKGNIKFELKANKGSILTDISISVIGGGAGNFVFKLIEFIYKKLKKEKELGREIKPVNISTTREEYIITGDKESKIPEEIKYKLSKKEKI
ncbi:MAG: hypothetical protein KKD48_04120 [Nanoarchaeota archaeon]|nr:hypothetical protein [Nanoarchaeota archaeon]